ncbi:unnamed protein product [Paramecium sonneborni]|uniref:Uncharacterized protein n=1 Tax=Paramecium sonneborni TaxID=65129 RepID=A0A8S1KU66_9CILI|nr:unnamed protein product [Paramecium sonneborni]
MDNQRDKQQKVECSPISEQNDYQDTTQKRDFPELHQLVREKEELIKWLLNHLQVAQNLCNQIAQIKNLDSNNNFQKLKRIIDESLKEAKCSGYSKETSVNPFDSPAKFNYNQENIHLENSYKSQKQFDISNVGVEKYERENTSQKQIDEILLIKGNIKANQESSQQQEFDQPQNQQQFSDSPENEFSSGYFINSSKEQKVKQQFCILRKNTNELQKEHQILKQDIKSLKLTQKQFNQQEVKQLQFQFQKYLAFQINQKIKQKITQKLQTVYLGMKEQFSTLQQMINFQNQELRKKIQILQTEFKEKLKEIIANQNQSNLMKIQTLSYNLSEINKQNEELQKKIQLYQFDDQKVYSLLKRFEQNQDQVSQNGNQAFQKISMVEELNLQVTQIKKAVMKDFENQIKNQEQVIQRQEMIITNLESEKKQLKEQLIQNNSCDILNETLKKLQEQETKNFQLSSQIYDKADQITQLKVEIQSLNKYISRKQDEFTNQLTLEHENITKQHLEGCFNLQQQSILFSFLGLQIFRQYIISENSEQIQINKTMEKLNKFNLLCQQKENQKLQEINKINELYINQQNQLKEIYDETLLQFKQLLSNIKDRRMKAQ